MPPYCNKQPQQRSNSLNNTEINSLPWWPFAQGITTVWSIMLQPKILVANGNQSNKTMIECTGSVVAERFTSSRNTGKYLKDFGWKIWNHWLGLSAITLAAGCTSTEDLGLN